MAKCVMSEEGNTPANSKLSLLDVGFYKWLLNKIWQKDKVGERFEFLVVGATGTGKSTLINNILGKEVAEVGSSPLSVTDEIRYYDDSICGVKVKIYDSPGLGDSSNDPGKEERHLKEMEDIMRGNIAMVIFCFNMTEKRMTSWNIQTFKTYHRRLNLKWNKVIIALTHADVVPCHQKTRPPEEVYKESLKKWELNIWQVLTEKVSISKPSVSDLRIQPVSVNTKTNLPDGEDWFTSLWLLMLEILDSRPMFTFLRMYIQNMEISGISMDKDMEELDKLINEWYLDSQHQPSSEHPPLSDRPPSSNSRPLSDRPPSSNSRPLSDRPPSLDRPPSADHSQSIHPQQPSGEEGQRNPPCVRLSRFKRFIRFLLSVMEKAPAAIRVPDRILQWMRRYCEN